MNFFILGLPRSRTTWLSAYLSGEDCVCFHELFSCPSVNSEVFWQLEAKYKGSVDTNPIYASGHHIDPTAPLIIIKRPPEQVVESLVKEFGAEHRVFIQKAVESFSEALTEQELMANYIINYDDLNDRLEDIWNLCRPWEDFCPVRAEMFKHMKIETMGLDFKDFKREVEASWQQV